MPPPAPLRACATLSDCWAAVVVGAMVLFKSVDIWDGKFRRVLGYQGDSRRVRS